MSVIGANDVVSKLTKEQKDSVRLIELNVDSNYLKSNKLKADLLNMENADEQFKRKFALLDKGFLSIVTDINKLAKINLAHLVFDCLVKGIRER
ncbi:hypothetical protein ACJIZ3_006165 [Penstemon smallii]|uniref:Uncharacterized protein n=1 Tax=Penstemon smallii TaxID=265156 RepID=A0ABD3S6X0_9LAMI